MMLAIEELLLSPLPQPSGSGGGDMRAPSTKQPMGKGEGLPEPKPIGSDGKANPKPATPQPGGSGEAGFSAQMSKTKRRRAKRKRREAERAASELPSGSTMETATVRRGMTTRQDTDPDQRTQQRPANSPFLGPEEGPRSSAKEQSGLTLMVHREDGSPMDDQLASAVRKGLGESIAEALDAGMGGETLPLPKMKKSGRIPLKTGVALRVPNEESPDKVFVMTHREILTEMQMKYTGLYNLSKKTGHLLLAEIAKKIFARLKKVADGFPEALATGFKLSGAYRRSHPHFGDFQLILSTLHRLQAAAGAPPADLSEGDLTAPPAPPLGFDNVPFEKVQSACAKYSDKISHKISEHVKKLNSEIGSGDSEEEIARKKVREELKKLTPYMSLIIKEVISNHFIPRKGPFHKIRIYGEPFMPNKEAMTSVLKKHRAVSIMRSDRMFNLLRFNIPLQQYPALMAMDGTVIGGAKLVIRSSELPTYTVSQQLIAEMRAAMGASPDGDVGLSDEQAEHDDYEEIEM